MEISSDTPVKNPFVRCLLQLIHTQCGGLEISALVGDAIAAHGRMNMWAFQVSMKKKGAPPEKPKVTSIDRWMEIVEFFSLAEDECIAAVRRFNEGGDRQDLAVALRQVTAKLNQRPDPMLPPSKISNTAVGW